LLTSRISEYYSLELKSDRDICLMLVGLDTVDSNSSRLLKAAMWWGIDEEKLTSDSSDQLYMSLSLLDENLSSTDCMDSLTEIFMEQWNRFRSTMRSGHTRLE
jgi:hypothetical protein